MSRFYKTARPTFAADMIADVPQELMLGALQKHDEAIEKAKGESGELEDMLAKIENLKTDDELVVGEKNKFRDKARELEDKIIQDPANYIKYSSQIRDLSRDLSKSLDTGVFKRASDNVGLKTTFETGIKESGAAASTKDNAIQLAEKRYDAVGGVNLKGEADYNLYGAGTQYETLFDAPDELAMINEIGANFKPDSSSRSSTGTGGGYFTTRGSKKVSVSEEDVDNFMENLLTNNKWEEAVRQDIYFDYANNRNMDISKDDPEIEAELQRRKLAFKEAAKEKIAFTQKDSTKKMSVDSAQQALDAYNRRNQVISVTKETDYFTNLQRASYTNGVTSVLNSDQAKELGITSEEVLTEKLRSFNGNVDAIDTYLSQFNVKGVSSLPFQKRKEFINNLKKSYSVNTEEFITMEELAKKRSDLNSEQLKVLYNTVNGQEKGIANKIRNVDPSTNVDYIRVSYPDGTVKEMEDKSYFDLFDSGFLTKGALGSEIAEVIVQVPATNDLGVFIVNGQPAEINDAEGIPRAMTLEEIHAAGKKVDRIPQKMAVENFLKGGTTLKGALVSRNKDLTGKETIGTTQTLELVGKNGKKEIISISLDQNLEDLDFQVK